MSYPFFLNILLASQGSYPSQTLPHIIGTISLSATRSTQSSPHGLPVGTCHAIVRASRVATSLILPACQCQYPGGNRPVPVSLTSRSVIGLSHIVKWVGFRIARFEACSAFTHIPARKFAKSSNDDPSIQSASNHVVTSMIRPGCYQPERQLLGRFRTCQRKAPFHGARDMRANAEYPATCSRCCVKATTHLPLYRSHSTAMQLIYSTTQIKSFPIKTHKNLTALSGWASSYNRTYFYKLHR